MLISACMSRQGGIQIHSSGQPHSNRSSPHATASEYLTRLLIGACSREPYVLLVNGRQLVVKLSRATYWGAEV
jgi:hypothetical protein